MRKQILVQGFVCILFGIIFTSGLVGCRDNEEDTPKVLVDHPSLLERHSLEGTYPRFSAEQLSLAGFPDHMHAFAWPGWQAMVDENGVTYGPHSLCHRHELIPREGLLTEDGAIRYQSFHLAFDSRYHACDMMPFVEMLSWARHDLFNLLGLVRQDTLHIYNPNNTADYREKTGLGTWRMYKRAEDKYLVQAIATLYARGLAGHAAFELVTEWTLRGVLDDRLPPWFETGLMHYLGENGCHLVNYMRPYRPKGSVVLTPEQVNVILASPPNPDVGLDTENFRKACYSAFIMVWNLIENRGGLPAMRKYFAKVAEGKSLDEAAQKIWHADLAQLRQQLNPVELGEPLGDAVQSRSPHRPPEPPNEETTDAEADTTH